MPFAKSKKLFRHITLVLAVLFLLEISYRFYLVDFYSPELKGLNTPV